MSTDRAAESPEVAWTPRQREVLDLLARGYTNGQLAEALGISLDGAKWHVSEVITKLGVDTREEAADYWRRQNGIVGRFRTFRRRRVSRALVWLGAGAAAAALVALPLLLLSGGSKAQANEWVRLPDSPLDPRASVIGVWTGEEVLFIGGTTWRCPPFADCLGIIEPILGDGAALDPRTGAWRTISPAPFPLYSASTAVIDDDVYFLAAARGPDWFTAFLRYSITDDAWEELEPPADGYLRRMVSDDVVMLQPSSLADAASRYRLAAAGDVVVVYLATHEGGTGVDFIFEPATGAWRPLLPDLESPGFSRTMEFANGRLFLFDHELVPNPGSTAPSLTRVARFDFDTGRWERLPDTGMLGSTFYNTGDAFIDAGRLGGTDGGSVNNWGRVYPWGGIVDARTGEWSPLPNTPGVTEDEEWSAGVFDEGGARYSGSRGGWLLDLRRGRWIQMPRLDPEPFTYRTVVSAGRDAVAFAGVRWGADGFSGGELLGDAWIWRAPE